AAAGSVGVGYVVKRDGQLAGPPDRGERLIVRRATPTERCTRCLRCSADRPAAESDHADPDSRSAELAILHHNRTCLTSSISLKERRKFSVWESSGESTVMMAIAFPPLALRARLYSAMLISRSPRSVPTLPTTPGTSLLIT